MNINAEGEISFDIRAHCTDISTRTRRTFTTSGSPPCYLYPVSRCCRLSVLRPLAVRLLAACLMGPLATLLLQLEHLQLHWNPRSRVRLK